MPCMPSRRYKGARRSQHRWQLLNRVLPVCCNSTVWPETGADALPEHSDARPLNTPEQCPACPQDVIRGGGVQAGGLSNFETTIFDVRVMLPDWQHDAAKLETKLTVDVWVLLKTVTPRPRSGTSPLRGELKILT